MFGKGRYFFLVGLALSPSQAQAEVGVAPAPLLTPDPVPTTIAAVLNVVSLTDQTSNHGPRHRPFGHCYEQTATELNALGSDQNSFRTVYRQTASTDCEVVLTGGGAVEARISPDYTIDFDITCPAGSSYAIEVEQELSGALTINRDNYDGCDAPFFGTTGRATARLSMVSGSHVGGSLAAGSLDLAAGGELDQNTDGDLAVAGATVARLEGVGTGAPLRHSLSFHWESVCTSRGDAWDTGAECSVRLGLSSDIRPNGLGGCMAADDYPGIGDRRQADDGHFVSVTATCTAFAARSTPLATRTAEGLPPTPEPLPAPTSTPTPNPPLGILRLDIADGSNAYCPADDSSGSFLKTRGNPTGGIPGTVCSGSNGNFSGGPIVFAAGSIGLTGRADLIVSEPVVVGAGLNRRTPNCGSTCAACWRIEDDTTALGFVDCDGGSNADAALFVDSNGATAPPDPFFDPSWLRAGEDDVDGGPGAAVVRVSVKRLRVNGSSSCPGVNAPRWERIPSEPHAIVTGTSTTRVDNRRRCAGSLFGTACPSDDSFTVSLGGSNLSCENWGNARGLKLVMSAVDLDAEIGGSWGAGDVAQVIRFANE